MSNDPRDLTGCEDLRDVGVVLDETEMLRRHIQIDVARAVMVGAFADHGDPCARMWMSRRPLWPTDDMNDPAYWIGYTDSARGWNLWMLDAAGHVRRGCTHREPVMLRQNFTLVVRRRATHHPQPMPAES